MQNAHLRLGRLEYRRNTDKTQTSISVQVDRYMGDGEQAHLISVFGNDAEVGAITAAIQENNKFEVVFPDGTRQTVFFGKDPSCYKGSLNLPGQKKTIRHLVAASALLHANGSAGIIYIFNYGGIRKDLVWATVLGLLGVPGDPRWAESIIDELEEGNKLKPLSGIGCEPVAIALTRDELLTM